MQHSTKQGFMPENAVSGILLKETSVVSKSTKQILQDSSKETFTNINLNTDNKNKQHSTKQGSTPDNAVSGTDVKALLKETSGLSETTDQILQDSSKETFTISRNTDNENKQHSTKQGSTPDNAVSGPEAKALLKETSAVSESTNQILQDSSKDTSTNTNQKKDSENMQYSTKQGSTPDNAVSRTEAKTLLKETSAVSKSTNQILQDSKETSTNTNLNNGNENMQHSTKQGSKPDNAVSGTEAKALLKETSAVSENTDQILQGSSKETSTITNQNKDNKNMQHSTQQASMSDNAVSSTEAKTLLKETSPVSETTDQILQDSVDTSTVTSNSGDNVMSVYNILLLGETGVGKSTFLNAFRNYIHFSSLREALDAEEIPSLLPSRFTLTDFDLNEYDITYGKPDENERLIPGKSATKACKTYNFTFGDVSLRFIDTPGIVDTKGMKSDDQNLISLIDYLGDIDHVNAILILLKPNESRLTVLFQYCLKRLLSCLERSASQNIIFLFTHSRGTFYRPGDVVKPLRTILNEIARSPPYITVPYGASNIFCVDNEAFKYLVASRCGYSLEEAMQMNLTQSWDVSANMCDRLLKYIVSLKGHMIKNSISVMEARKTIDRLRWPLGRILRHIAENISRITSAEDELLRTDGQISKLAENLLYNPIALHIRRLDQPRTVCTHRSCMGWRHVAGCAYPYYKVACHEPCNLKKVPVHMIGDETLKCCWAMTNGICRRCSHSYLDHQHIFYETVQYIDTVKDEKTADNINKKETERESTETALKYLTQQKVSYEEEKSTVLKALAKFAHFLQHSAIVPYNDVFETYIKHLIEQEKDRGGIARNKVIDDYRMLIEAYHEEVDVLKRELEKLKGEDASALTIVTTPEVIDIINGLFELNLTGKYIKDMYNEEQEHLSIIVKAKAPEAIIEVIPPKSSNKALAPFKWLYKKAMNKLNEFTDQIEEGILL